MQTIFITSINVVSSIPGHKKFIIIAALDAMLFLFNISSAVPYNDNDNDAGAEDNGDSIIVTQAMTKTTPDSDHNTITSVVVYED